MPCRAVPWGASNGSSSSSSGGVEIRRRGGGGVGGRRCFILWGGEGWGVEATTKTTPCHTRGSTSSLSLSLHSLDDKEEEEEEEEEEKDGGKRTNDVSADSIAL